MGIEQWLALGVLSGVLSFIPNFGTIGAILPSIAVAAVQAPNSVLLVILLILGMSFLQAQVVGPLLTNERMNLAPVLILLGQIVFGIFFGFIGLMLAVPLIAITVVLVEEIYIKDVLGDDSSEKPKNEEEDLEDELVFAETD
jgi:predicted PurR-regulated permease PerM